MTKLKADQVTCSCGRVVNWLDACPNNKPLFSEGQICRECYTRNQAEYFAQQDREVARLKRIQSMVDRTLFQDPPFDWTRVSAALRTGGDVEAASLIDTAAAVVQMCGDLKHSRSNP
jgi:hypothetical protein